MKVNESRKQNRDSKEREKMKTAGEKEKKKNIR